MREVPYENGYGPAGVAGNVARHMDRETDT